MDKNRDLTVDLHMTFTEGNAYQELSVHGSDRSGETILVGLPMSFGAALAAIMKQEAPGFVPGDDYMDNIGQVFSEGFKKVFKGEDVMVGELDKETAKNYQKHPEEPLSTEISSKDSIYFGSSGYANPKIILQGNHRSYNFYIVSLGTHPCAYVSFKEKTFEQLPSWMHEVAHGGITYNGRGLHFLPESSEWFVGWDYSHPGDWLYFNEAANLDGKKWTLREIEREVMDFIDEVVKRMGEQPRPEKKAGKKEKDWNEFF